MEQSTEKTKKTSNRFNQGSLYCRPENRRQPLLGRTSGKWCPSCNFRIRGANHEEGAHHQGLITKGRRGKKF